MKDITFSQGKISDFDEFYSVFVKNLKEQFVEYTKNTVEFYLDDAYKKESLKEQIENGKKAYFIAKYKNKKIVGYFLVTKTFGGVGFANWIGVVKEFQNKGIATNLLNIWEKYALKQKAHALQLWTTERNIDFYKNRGFIKAGELPKFWFGIDHYLFYKHLQTPREENYLYEFLKKRK